MLCYLLRVKAGETLSKYQKKCLALALKDLFKTYFIRKSTHRIGLGNLMVYFTNGKWQRSPFQRTKIMR